LYYKDDELAEFRHEAFLEECGLSHMMTWAMVMSGQKIPNRDEMTYDLYTNYEWYAFDDSYY
jgi:hypothetical protein